MKSANKFDGSDARNLSVAGIFVFAVLVLLPSFAGCRKSAVPRASKPQAAAVSRPASIAALDASGESCRAFVQEFYDWYVPIAGSSNERFTGILHPRRSSFDPKLWNMLAADDAAQMQADEIVGLDFDPICNSQDPSPKFLVKSASVKDGRCSAAVVGRMEETDEEQVAPELVFSGGHWIFVNFHYRFEINGKWTDGDLVQILEDLRRSRAEDASSTKK